jgi:ribonucleoside-diphosphate reductase alpha chain
MGHTTNPDVRIAKSVVDYIFRWLGITFLDGFREASNGLPLGEKSSAAGEDVFGHDVAAEKGNGHLSGAGKGSANGHGQAAHKKMDMAVLERAGVVAVQSEQFASFQSDAPACDNCGAITVRTGNCYLCHNCGNSMGCS